jgi:hypothetical protein
MDMFSRYVLHAAMPRTTCLLLASKRITGEIQLPRRSSFPYVCSVNEERLLITKYRNYRGLVFSQQIGFAVCNTDRGLYIQKDYGL